MEHEYDLETLVNTFIVHAEEFRKSNEELRESFDDETLPEFLEDEFNLPFALSVICEEIIKIKEKINDKKSCD